MPEVLSTPLQISVPLTAVKIGKFRPLPEPIRLQDLVHLARSRAEKKIRNVIIRLQVEYNMFFKSATEIGTSCASMNRTGKTNAKKGPHKDYNAYRDFHEREFEGHTLSAFMEYAGMKDVEGQTKAFFFHCKFEFFKKLSSSFDYQVFTLFHRSQLNKAQLMLILV